MRYFDKIPSDILCRGGGNGPMHPSQVEGLALVEEGESLLDVGCGSATTAECLGKKDVKYKGVDAIEKHIDWCKAAFPQHEFEVQHALKLKEKDQSWDVVWARHVVDHVRSFEEAMDEFRRVAKKKIICILWYAMFEGEEHIIKPIVDGDITYKDEWLNRYSIGKVLGYIDTIKQDWKCTIEFAVGEVPRNNDTIIYLERR